ncbi:hypothetical protein BKI52_44215 [marine bacterium AO1-C]|nr:hypothetical protein BKI52_44215 [marine bacterium AO1-C]
MDCIEATYQQKSVNLRAKLDSLERFLIQQKVLKSASGQGYFDFVDQIEAYGEVPHKYDYDVMYDYFKKASLDQIELSSNEYSLACSKKLLQTDYENLTNSKLFRLQSAIEEREKTSLYGITSATIASEMKYIIKQEGFEHFLYKSLVLRIIAKEMSLPQKALPIVLPPQKSDTVYVGFKKVQILMNSENEIYWEQEKINLPKLESKLKGFIASKLNTHCLDLKTHRGTSYKAYISLHNEIQRIYNVVRNEKAIEKYGKPLRELPLPNQEKIKKLYPVRIQESKN